MADFASALARLWPNGDQKIPGLRAGIIASAPAVFAKYGVKDSLVLAHIMAHRGEKHPAQNHNHNHFSRKREESYPTTNDRSTVTRTDQ